MRFSLFLPYTQTHSVEWIQDLNPIAMRSQQRTRLDEELFRCHSMMMEFRIRMLALYLSPKSHKLKKDFSLWDPRVLWTPLPPYMCAPSALYVLYFLNFFIRLYHFCLRYFLCAYFWLDSFFVVQERGFHFVFNAWHSGGILKQI